MYQYSSFANSGKGFDVLFHLTHEIPQTLPAFELTTKLNGVAVTM